MTPRARTAGLLVRRLPGELVVYDTTTHRAHCLNRTAAMVFRLADGTRSVEGLALLVAGTTAGTDCVDAALAELAAADLLERPVAPTGTVPRREVLHQIGLGAAVLAPVVTSLLVPTPAQAAASCIAETDCTGANDGTPCYIGGNPADCANGRTCQGLNTCTL